MTNGGFRRRVQPIDDPIVVREILTHLDRWQPEALERARTCLNDVSGCSICHHMACSPSMHHAHTSTTPKSAPEAAFDGRRPGFRRRFLTAWDGRRG